MSSLSTIKNSRVPRARSGCNEANCGGKRGQHAVCGSHATLALALLRRAQPATNVAEDARACLDQGADGAAGAREDFAADVWGTTVRVDHARGYFQDLRSTAKCAIRNINVRVRQCHPLRTQL